MPRHPGARYHACYDFSAGQTNVFAVEISVRSETGNEVMANRVKISCQANLKRNRKIKTTDKNGRKT